MRRTRRLRRQRTMRHSGGARRKCRNGSVRDISHIGVSEGEWDRHRATAPAAPKRRRARTRECRRGANVVLARLSRQVCGAREDGYGHGGREGTTARTATGTTAKRTRRPRRERPQGRTRRPRGIARRTAPRTRGGVLCVMVCGHAHTVTHSGTAQLRRRETPHRAAVSTQLSAAAEARSGAA